MQPSDIKHSEFCTLEEATNLFHRIMKRCEWSDGCLLWKSGKGESGHARFWFRGRMYQVTHLVWLICKGELVPTDKVMRHKCDVRSCICHDHLELGTQKENVGDAIVRGRFKGHENLRKKTGKSFSTLEENPLNF